MHRLLIALSFCAACTATVRTVPPPAEPATTPVAPPPAPPPGPVATNPPPPAPAPLPPRNPAHPHYGDAIQNLRIARLLIDRNQRQAPEVKFDQQVAANEIIAAIKEIKEARQDDGMADAKFDYPIDPKVTYGDRLRDAYKHVTMAKQDLEQREDNAWGRQDRREALEHINKAHQAIAAAIGERAEATPPPPPAPAPAPAPAAHPAYATALGNLRHARALLERPAGAADVKWDEHVAIREVEAAFGEIRQARMDDGVPITEHAPIDAKLVYRDRLREALNLLGDAARDLEQKEDNAWAKKDRKQAVDHVHRAEQAIREAISDRKADNQEKKEEKREEKAEKKGAKGH